MAETWHALHTSVAFASGKSMADLFNTDGTKIEKVWRCWCFNATTATVTGGMTNMRIYRLTTGAPTGGSTVTALAHDTNNAALPAGVTSGTGRTPTRGSAFRQWYWSTDESATGAGTIDELECLVPNALVWDSGYADSNVQPITCRQNFGFELRQEGTTAVASTQIDVDFEFTNE